MTDRVLPPKATSSLMAMSMSLTREAAQHWVDKALDEGATEDEVAPFIAKWEADRAAEVRVIHSQPHPIPVRCKCSHPRHRGRCPLAACGCANYREKDSA